MAVNAGKNTSNNFDQPPVYDPITKTMPSVISNSWSDWISTFLQTLLGYLTQNGICMPQLTTVQRDALVNPIGGQMIYNTTTDAIQVFIISSQSPYQGNWKTVTVS